MCRTFFNEENGVARRKIARHPTNPPEKMSCGHVEQAIISFSVALNPEAFITEMCQRETEGAYQSRPENLIYLKAMLSDKK